MNDRNLTPREEELLAALVAGDLTGSEPEVAAALGSAAFAAAWRELQALQQELQHAGARERDLMAEAERHSDLGDADLVRAAVPWPPRRRGRGPWLFAAAAVAAGLLVWAWAAGFFTAPVRPRPDDHQPLGSAEVGELQSVLVEDGALSLRWASRLPHALFTVTIYDPVQPDAPLLVYEDLEDARCTVDRQQRKDWPQGLRWRVVAHAAGKGYAAEAALRY